MEARDENVDRIEIEIEEDVMERVNENAIREPEKSSKKREKLKTNEKN